MSGKNNFVLLRANYHKNAETRRPNFCSEVNTHFASLGLDRGAIDIAFEDRESAEGLEQLELLARTVEKFDFAPLRKIASGGEMTRVNLAIQAVAAKTAIFHV